MGQSLFELLQQYGGTALPFHMPGHKRNTALAGADGYLSELGARCDITEIDGFDNLAEPSGVLKELKERVARLYHSEQTEILVNGSTCGILAAIEATVTYGGTVLVARNCHKSVYNGLRLKNARVHYLLPPVDRRTGIAGAISCEEVRRVLGLEEWADGQAFPMEEGRAGQTGQVVGRSGRISLLILTSPTYEGISCDIRGICEAAHRVQVPVLVDGAHGAHFGFGGFPESAVAAGADLVVQSLHKTLPSLTQTALLHRNGTLVSPERVRQAVNTFQTSSPSYLFLASVDGCARLMEKKELWDNWEAALDLFYERARAWKVLSLPVMGLGVARAAEKQATAGQACGESVQATPKQAAAGKDGREGVQMAARTQKADRSKLVIGTERAGKSGAWLMDKLRQEYRIELEMAAGRYVIAMTGAGDTKETVSRLAGALDEIDRELEKEQKPGEEESRKSEGTKQKEQEEEKAQEKTEKTTGIERNALLPYPEIVFTAADTEQMPREECPVRDAVGKIAAEYVFAYPPGVPLLVPGERITKEVLRLLEWNREKEIVLHGTAGVISDRIIVVEEK